MLSTLPPVPPRTRDNSDLQALITATAAAESANPLSSLQPHAPLLPLPCTPQEGTLRPNPYHFATDRWESSLSADDLDSQMDFSVGSESSERTGIAGSGYSSDRFSHDSTEIADICDAAPIPVPNTLAPEPFFADPLWLPSPFSVPQAAVPLSDHPCQDERRPRTFANIPQLNQSPPQQLHVPLAKPHRSIPSAQDADALAERKCTKEATRLLEQCIQTCPLLNLYRIQSLLGYGTFGIVVEAENTHQQKVAIKIMRKAQIHASRMVPDRHVGMIPLEIAILKYKPAHPHLLQYVDAWQDDQCWYLVTDLGGCAWEPGSVNLETSMPLPSSSTPFRLPNLFAKKRNTSTRSKPRIHVYGTDPSQPPQSVVIPRHTNNHSMAGYLRACGAYSGPACTLPQTQTFGSTFTDSSCSSSNSSSGSRSVIHPRIQLHIFQQLVDAVYTLHQHGIVHKDLKDENVLVDKQLHVKLIDFGHSAFFRLSDPGNAPGHMQLFKTYGTPLFASPEVRSGLKYVGPEGDIYALGLMLYEMNYGDLPENLDAAVYVCGGETPFDMSERAGFSDPNIRDLCAWMLCPDPALRPTITQVSEHLYQIASQW